MTDEEIIIIEYDPVKVMEDIKQIYEEKTGNTLAESEPRWIDYHVIAAYISSIKAEMNDVAKQNYLRYARGKRLELKGELYGERGGKIKAGKARTTMRCYIQEAKSRKIIIPAGTRFVKDAYVFSSLNEAVIEAGTLYADTIVECLTEGYVPIFDIGEVKEIIDIFDYFETCENISKVIGGVDEEEDEKYRERLEEVPESFTTAGPEESYKFWSKTASDEIKDVVVVSPAPCYIDIYLLGNNGNLISEEIKKLVLEVVNDKEKRPQGDRVELKDPTVINFTIDFSYTLYKKDEVRALEIGELIKNKIDEYAKEISNKMGKEINIQDIIEIVKNCGAKRVIIRNPIDRKLEITEVAKCTEINIESSGVE